MVSPWSVQGSREFISKLILYVAVAVSLSVIPENMNAFALIVVVAIIGIGPEYINEEAEGSAPLVV